MLNALDGEPDKKAQAQFVRERGGAAPRQQGCSPCGSFTKHAPIHVCRNTEERAKLCAFE